MGQRVGVLSLCADKKYMSETLAKAPPKGGAFSAILDTTLTVMNTIGSFWIFVLMIMIDTDAFSRTFFNHPFHGVIELVEVSIVGIVFLQLGDATRQGRLTRSDGFFNIVKSHRPNVGRYMGATFDLLGAVFFAIVLFGAVPELYDAWVNDYFVGEQGLFTFPKWPIRAVIVLGCVVTFLHFIRMAIQYLWPLMDRPSQPLKTSD
jgi:TRAP-type mannitol/chloroaromatic compound transport system permease small subunit